MQKLYTTIAMTCAIGLAAAPQAHADSWPFFVFTGDIGLGYSERQNSVGQRYTYHSAFLGFETRAYLNEQRTLRGVLTYDGLYSLDGGSRDHLDRLHAYLEYDIDQFSVGVGIVPSAIDQILTHDRVTFPALYDRQVGAWYYGPTTDYLQYGDYDDTIIGIQTAGTFGGFESYSSFHFLPDTSESLFAMAGRYHVTEDFNVFGGFETRINWRNDNDDPRYWVGARGDLGDFQITGTWNRGNAGISTSDEVRATVLDILYMPQDDLTLGVTFSDLTNSSWNDRVFAFGASFEPVPNFTVEGNIGTSAIDDRNFFGISANYRF